jgi:hypothetical protein
VNSALYCEVLFEALGCKSQKMSKPTGKWGTVSPCKYQTPYSPSNTRENSRTTVANS